MNERTRVIQPEGKKAKGSGQECPLQMYARLALLGWVCQAGDMKKQASDQSFHDRRYQERKRAAAARKPAQKKVVEGSGRESGKQSGESRVTSSE